MSRAFRHSHRIAALISAVAAAGPSWAQDAPRTDIGTVGAASGPAGSGPAAPGTAPYLAPSLPPLSATQPTSVVGPNFIRNNVVPTNNYDDIIKFTPSVQNVSPAGVGLQQNFQETIRGFRYTQFNTLFDGLVLPGTLTSFAPQTGTYFLAHDIGSVSVDRGPGTASTIGYATFGGTVSILSKTPSDTVRINPYGTFGSWNTRQTGIELDSGVRPELNGARGMVDFSNTQGDGYLTNISTLRNNGFTKLEVPVGDNTVITFVGMVNGSRTHTPYGAQLSQIQTLGADYGLNQDPRSQAYKAYNVDNYNTDFEYVGLHSDLGDGWGIDDKAYTVSYYHNGTQGQDPNGTTSNLTGRFFVNGARVTLNNDVPGQAVHTDFRSWGNVLRVTKDTAYGQARAGIWTDYNSGTSYRANIVLTQGNQAYTTSASATAYRFEYKSDLTTVQPYVEFAAKPLPGLTITPGLKYTSVTRNLNAVVNNSTKVPAKFGETWDSLQPAIDAHYEIRPGWVAYAQVAEGFLAPPLNTLFVFTPNTSLKPQETTNYQIGTTFQNDRFALAGDFYYIDFRNYIGTQTTSNGTVYTNNGNAVFKGLELEGTVQVVDGLAVYANGTLNSADYTSGHPVALNPRQTAAFGPILQRDNFYASFLYKFVGPQYGQDGAGPTSQPLFPVKSYQFADIALGYTLPLPQLGDRSLNFRLNLLNIFNDHSLIGVAGTTSNGTPLYWTNPGRAGFFSISAAL